MGGTPGGEGGRRLPQGVVLNALVWLVELDVPADGVVSRVTEAEMMANLDPKKK